MKTKEEKLKKLQSASVLSKPETMIVQLQIIGGGPNEVQRVSEYMSRFEKENNLGIKFIVSNDHIELRSVDWLIAELMQLKEMESENNGKD